MVSGLLLILGIIVLISDASAFSKGWVHLKIMLGVIAVGFVHVSSIKTKKYLNSGMEPADRIKINIIRAITIGLIMTTYTLTEVSQAKENPKIVTSSGMTKDKFSQQLKSIYFFLKRTLRFLIHL